MNDMNVGLSPRAAEQVASRVAAGQFGSESDVIEAALDALTREELDLADVDWEHVKRKLAEADASVAAGRGRRIDDVDGYFAELRADVTQRAAKRNPA